MLKNREHFSKPMNSTEPGDVLSQILNSIGISGSVLLKEEYCSPWAVSVPQSTQLNILLNTAKNIRVATFHWVERGQLNLKFDSGDDVSIEQGEMIVCFSGQGHTLYQGISQTTTSFANIMAGTENIYKPEVKGDKSSTLLVCGVFLLHDTSLNPLLSSLPPVLKLDVTNSDKFPRLYGVIQLMVQEFNDYSVGNSYVIERYLEILCAETIRAHIERLPEQATGWLSAINDPLIGKSIEAIHLNPEFNWSVMELASKVAMSSSRFAARFVAAVGEPPMIYVTKWRMYLASRDLRETSNSIEQIGNKVGYENMASFSRAFKRHMGTSPGAWRLDS
ncbi:MAG: AraC family transcriptional regulator [Gammaproteobacteria bacterium]|nr:AraC family transcriptional regulator [Gammaproteobacteria bacterium]